MSRGIVYLDRRTLAVLRFRVAPSLAKDAAEQIVSSTDRNQSGRDLTVSH
jgi:hypothetical protein